MNEWPLSPRLLAAAALCEGARSVIDVGCDHAQLCIFLARRDPALLLYASDLREGPLAAARRNLAEAGLSARVLTVLCGGLSAFSPDDGDTIVICGMGGELIAQILADAPWALDGRRLVLQPMTRADALRAFLAARGCTVTDERLVAEDGRLYCVLAAHGGGVPHTPAQLLFTDAMRREPLFCDYLLRERARLIQIIQGRARGGADSTPERAMLTYIDGEVAQCRSTH
ncbi:MAG: hypothetical protein ABT01_03925 [Clostridium sp. SCN 57-10]|nr:MAG: hypothetical protein ABT01_03925 [Clostridium sp. SCN 57-10]